MPVKGIAQPKAERGLLGGIVAAALVAGGAGAAQAAEWTFGDVVITNQNQVSVGATIRTSPRDERFIGTPNGGSLALTPAGDNGNLNFDQGSITSNPITAQSELSVIWSPGNNQRFGAYVRGRAFYDWVFDVNNLDSNGFNPNLAVPPGVNPNSARSIYFNGALDPQAQDRARYGLEALDYYALASFDIAGNPFNIRVGNQILNWGEALFTQNAISIINPLDLQKFRVPGSELRDGLVPIKMVWASYELMPGLSFEGFYSWDFEGLVLEPAGTFFGSEGASQGAEGIGHIGFSCDGAAGLPRPTNPFGSGQIDDPSCGLGVPITYERRDQNRGDFGFAARYYSEELNNTEFGLYYVNYQSRFISIAYRTPDTLSANPADTTNRGEYYLYHPDDQKMYGLSFNTSIDSLGWALNGEFSYKENVPVILDDSIVTNAYLIASGVLPGMYANYPGLVNVPGVNGLPTGLQTLPCRLNANGTLNSGCAGQEIRYDTRVDAQNFNLRGTKSFQASSFVPSLLNADAWTVIVEGAVIHADFDTETFVGNAPNSVNVNNGPFITNFVSGNTPTRWSFGYTLVTNVTYPAVFGTAVNLTPGLAFSHGVSGTTPISGGFTEGVKSVNLSLKADYLINLSAAINFSKSWGGGAANTNADKDFLGLTVSYSF
ncbi:DUF1302 domain-containing protein [Zavarzinia sp. CC-PAN008]|uniref:DUF1302 domain-containing protein n=1 Tax=Zavarzinia sp. CC-PAN008 TaxID=3243332 RepID=UPI003F745090